MPIRKYDEKGNETSTNLRYCIEWGGRKDSYDDE